MSIRIELYFGTPWHHDTREGECRLIVIAYTDTDPVALEAIGDWLKKVGEVTADIDRAEFVLDAVTSQLLGLDGLTQLAEADGFIVEFTEDER